MSIQLRHEISQNLDEGERKRLKASLDRENGLALASGIVEHWLSEAPYHKEWYRNNIGVICFVKDYSKKSYFFRLYTIDGILVWEQEMYLPFHYAKANGQFHYFAGDDSNVGFNFSFGDEADKFASTVISKLNAKQNNRDSTMSMMDSGAATAPPPVPSVPTTMRRSTIMTQPIREESFMPQSARAPPMMSAIREETTVGMSSVRTTGEVIRYGNTVKTKKRISKSKISGPDGFRHIQHVGLTNNNYDMSGVSDNNPMIEQILSQLNMKVNRKTQAFVGNFIESHGGASKFDSELRSQATRATTKPQAISSRVTQMFSKQPLPPPPPPEPTMLDHLKMEMDKRAQYLNASSSEDELRSDSEWN